MNWEIVHLRDGQLGIGPSNELDKSTTFAGRNLAIRDFTEVMKEALQGLGACQLLAQMIVSIVCVYLQSLFADASRQATDKDSSIIGIRRVRRISRRRAVEEGGAERTGARHSS